MVIFNFFIHIVKGMEVRKQVKCRFFTDALYPRDVVRGITHQRLQIDELPGFEAILLPELLLRVKRGCGLAGLGNHQLDVERLTLTEEYDSSANSSRLTVAVGVKSSAYYSYTYYLTGSLKVDGREVVSMNSATPTHYVIPITLNTYYRIRGNSGYTDSPWEVADIPHLTDGSKTVKVELTLKEYQLLKLLMENKNKVLTRDTILERVWGYNFDGETRTADVHVRTLRSKLLRCSLVLFIVLEDS